MIDPLIAARLVQQAYDPVFVAGGVLPDLSVFGCSDVRSIYGLEGSTPYPFGFLATLSDGSQVIALRGTDNWNDATADANIRLIPNKDGCPGLVHRGFRSVTLTLGITADRAPIAPYIVNLSRLILCGHSLGGALVRQLSVELGHVGEVLTWGEPRSCDGAAAGYALSCTSSNRRAVNPTDPVPMLPVFDVANPRDGYRHVGEPLQLPSRHFFLEAHALTTYIALEAQLTTKAA